MAKVAAYKVQDPEWYVEIGDAGEEADPLLAVLGELPIFDELSQGDLAKVERIVHHRRFSAGEAVIRAWAPRTGMFVVLSGEVDVVRHLEDGTSEPIGRLGEGELLGEFAILDDTPRSTSIVAAGPCELVGFFRPDLMDLIQTDPKLGFKILYRMSQILGKRMGEVIGDLRGLRSQLHRAPRRAEVDV